MKLKFDSSLEYQKDAVGSVTDLFEGLPPNPGDFEVSLGASAFMGSQQNELGIGHALMPDADLLLKNLRLVQEQNTIPKSPRLLEEEDTY